ncbi:MAG: AraC-like DNA-binding protein [Oceanicoccus sp.]|jgi:AraC-like DNA-binding protein
MNENQYMNIYSNTDCHLSVLGDQPYPSYELRNIVRYLDNTQGMSSDALLKHVNLTKLTLEDNSIPVYKVLAAMKFCAQSFGPILGARIGSTYQVSDLGVFGYAIASTQTLEQAIQIERKYYPLLGNILKRGSTLQEQLMCETMYNIQNLDDDTFSFFIALGNSSRMQIARSIFGNDLRYHSVSFSFDDEKNKAEYEAIYGCPVEFNTKQNSWTIERAQFSRERKQQNYADISQYLPDCNELVASLKQDNSLVNEIQQILISCAGDYPDIEMLASAFNVSARTLRRQLASIGTSYQKILNKVRCQLSIEYLTRTELSIETISSLIGFRDVTNFRHAFKKWVGQTPNYYRKTYKQKPISPHV